MTGSIFIAKLLGPMFVVLGVALLSKGDSLRVILRQFIDSPVLLYLAGLFGLLGGLALALTHNIWSFDWRLLITLIGWVTLIRALVTIFMPQRIAAVGRLFLAHRAAFIVAAAINLAIGLVLSFFGYLAV